jgi:hypothetical protein
MTNSPDPQPSILEEVESGDRIRGLRALRRELAAAIEAGPPARDLASISRRLMQVMEELEGLDTPDEDAPTEEDELARRRAAVLSAAGVEHAAPGRDARTSGG